MTVLQMGNLQLVQVFILIVFIIKQGTGITITKNILQMTKTAKFLIGMR